MREISLLLGVGFSVNKGYPTAKQLNNKITSLTAAQFAVAQQGSVCWLKPEQEDPYTHTSYYIYKLFTLELIAFYADQHEYFNYEEFFDYYTNVNKHNDGAFEKLCNDFRKKHHNEDDNINLIAAHNSIFNQIIAGFLVDREGVRFYPNVHRMGPYAGYNGFLGCLQRWGKDRILHINTLNHDLFFGSLNHTDAINGELSDSFSELGSPYYGSLENQRKYAFPVFQENTLVISDFTNYMEV